MKDTLSQSAWRRGWNDTKTGWTSLQFLVLDVVVFAVIAGIAGWVWGLAFGVFAMLCVWIWATASAPRKQRNEAKQRIGELEDELKTPKLFDVKLRTTSMSLLIAKKEDGQWVAGTGAIGPAPVILINKKNLLTVTRLTLAPQARFIRNDDWQST